MQQKNVISESVKSASLKEEEIYLTLKEIQKLSDEVVNLYKGEFLSEIPFEFLQLSHFYDISSKIVTDLKADSKKITKIQEEFLHDFTTLYFDSVKKMSGLAQNLEQNTSPNPFYSDHADNLAEPKDDKRFTNPIWDENCFYSNLKKMYYLITKHTLLWLTQLKTLDLKTKEQVHLYVKNILNLLSPTNFFATNPDVIQETLRTNGVNFLRGYKNFLDDLIENKGHLNIRNTDLSAFKLGKNLAITPGHVIYQNDLMQLIQYTPTTTNVYKIPLLFIPPCINKYYILDLTPENSLVKYLVDQGFTVYMISWNNPDSRHSYKGFGNYMMEGPLKALDIITKTANVPSAHLVGYCIGGTLLGCTLGYMKKTNDTRAFSASYYMTLLDFSNPGELGVFIDKRQLHILDNIMKERGFLDGRLLETAFNILRPNDLIWPYFINDYLLGKTPKAFDLLYWNTDSTNQPYKMYSFYLRKMYLKNLLAKSNGITLKGVPIDLNEITLPSFFLASETDHISVWESVYAGTLLQNSPIEFVLSGSGHVAGVINPPSKMKHGFKTHSTYGKTKKMPKNPKHWLKTATHSPGSWWSYWVEWLKNQNNEQVPARDPLQQGISVIEDAPGSYVKKKI